MRLRAVLAAVAVVALVVVASCVPQADHGSCYLAGWQLTCEASS